MRPFHLFCINLSGPFRSNYVFELIRGDGHWASATFSSSFAIKCADRTHSRMVPSYKLECEGWACTNNKMAADCSPTSIPPVCQTIPLFPYPALVPICQQTYVPRRQPCFAGARTSSILSECLTVWNIGEPDLKSVFGPSLSMHAIVKNNEYLRSEIDRFFFTSFLPPFFFSFFAFYFDLFRHCCFGHRLNDCFDWYIPGLASRLLSTNI